MKYSRLYLYRAPIGIGFFLGRDDVIFVAVPVLLKIGHNFNLSRSGSYTILLEELQKRWH